MYRSLFLALILFIPDFKSEISANDKGLYSVCLPRILNKDFAFIHLNL